MDISHQTCRCCGVSRASIWFSLGSGRASLYSRCRPCVAHLARQTSESNQREREILDPVTVKVCCECKKKLPSDSFAKSRSSKDGFQNACKVCHNLIRSVRKSGRLVSFRNQTLVIASGTERICSKCLVNKPWADFNKDVSSTFGIYSNCRLCQNLQKRTANALKKPGAKD